MRTSDSSNPRKLEVQKALSREERATLRDLVKKLDKHVEGLYFNRRSG